MSNTIKLKRGTGSDPGSSALSVGEVALRTDNGKLFTKKDDGSVVQIGGGSGAIDDGAITNAKVASDAAIAGSKISPDFGSQNIVTTGALDVNGITIGGNTPTLNFTDANDNPDFRFLVNSNSFILEDTTNSANRFVVNSTGNVGIGETSPSNNLHLGASGADQKRSIKIDGTNGSSELQGVILESDGENAKFNIKMGVGGGTPATKLSVTNSGAGVTGNLEVGSGQITCGVHGTTGIQIINDGTFGTLHSADLTLRTASTTRATIDTSGNFNIPNDSGKIRLGASQDLQIYHDANNSIIANQTGELQIRGDNLLLLDNTNGHKHISALKDDAVELYYDNTKRFETTSGGSKVTGNFICTGDIVLDSDSNKLKLGLGEDLTIQHNGTNSIIDNNTGDLFIETTGSGDDIFIKSADDIFLQPNAGEDGIKIIGDGAVELYHDNSRKLYTTSDGIESNGELHFKAPASSTGEQVGRLEWWNENDAGVMAKIAVDRTASANAPADLVFSTSANVDTTANGGDGDITERLRITSAGDIQIPVDGDKLQFGAGQDLSIFHDGSNTYLQNITGNLIFKNNATDYIIFKNSDASTEVVGNLDVGAGIDCTGTLNLTGNLSMTAELNFVGGSDTSRYIDAQTGTADGTHAFHIRAVTGGDSGHENMAQFFGGAGVKLFHNGGLAKFETKNYGAFINGHLQMDDNNIIKLGNSNDLQIYHDASDSFITNSTGTLKIQTQVNIDKGDGSEHCARFIPDGAVVLYFNGNERFETTSAGATLSGSLTVSGTVDGRDVASDGSKLDGIASGATNVTNNNQLSNGAGYITSVSGQNYNSLSNLPTIPTNNNQLSNGAGYITSVSGQNYNSLSNLPTIPTNNNQLSNGAGYITSGSDRACRAWINFRGDSTVSIRDDVNFSSVSDNGTGEYGLTFSSNMPNANYCIAVGFFDNQGNANVAKIKDETQSASGFQIRTGFYGGGATNVPMDFDGVFCAVFAG